jgi:hypothetical protein
MPAIKAVVIGGDSIQIMIGIFNALTTSNEIPMLVSKKHFNPRQNLKCSTGGAGRKPKHRPTCFIHRWRNFSASGAS